MRFYRIFCAVLCATALHCRQSPHAGNKPEQEPDFYIEAGGSRLGVTTLLSGLDVPWEISWGADGYIWFTEQGGTVSRLDPASGERKIVLSIPAVYRRRSTGLLGMALHPRFKEYPYVYLDYTYQSGTSVQSRLVRYTFDNDTLLHPLTLLQDIPGGNGHNGSRICFGKDGMLYLTTGDATVASNAQDTSSLNGKVLRLTPDGGVPSDNPFPGSPVWSYGHRNQQGLVMTAGGTLYGSEHGDAIGDEINIIRKGGNYGWPSVEGFADTEKEKTFAAQMHVLQPIAAWTPTIAPAGLDYYASGNIPEWKNALLLTTLKDCGLRVLRLNAAGDSVVAQHKYLDNRLGRLRDLCVAPDGAVYVSTSNRDWNPNCKGFPQPDDDRIVRIERTGKATGRSSPVATAAAKETGASLYAQYCGACHQPDGSGFQGTFPALRNSPALRNKDTLIAKVLHGVSSGRYPQNMPAFAFLSDDRLAAILSHVRRTFGNGADSIAATSISIKRNKP